MWSKNNHETRIEQHEAKIYNKLNYRPSNHYNTFITASKTHTRLGFIITPSPSLKANNNVISKIESTAFESTEGILPSLMTMAEYNQHYLDH